MQHALQADKWIADYYSRERGFVDFVSQINNETCANIMRRIDVIGTEIAKENETIFALRRESESSSQKQQIGSTQTGIKRMESQRDNLREICRIHTLSTDELKTQFGLIHAIPRVKLAWVNGDRLCYITKPLFGRDHERRWRRIGPFHISFNIQHPIIDSFVWRNLEGPKKRVFHGPPNIVERDMDGGAGVPCPGNEANELLTEAARTNDFATIVGFSVRYPECAGQATNETITYWPLVYENEVPAWYLDQFSE